MRVPDSKARHVNTAWRGDTVAMMHDLRIVKSRVAVLRIRTFDPPPLRGTRPSQPQYCDSRRLEKP